MKIGQILKDKRASLSFEFFPPRDKAGEDNLFQNIAVLAKLKPDFASVTYGAGGGRSKNTFQVIKRIKQEAGLTAMPHLTCVNQSEAELKGILEEYRQIGVENVLAMRGDPPEVDGKPLKISNPDCYANNLVKLAASMNAFSIGVAGYPEGHPEAPDLETDMKYTKLKVDAGGEFIMTQMFFDNRYYYQYLERAAKAGIRVPIIPGILPVTDIERVKKFSVKCGATIPAGMLERLEKAGSNHDEAKKTGIEITTEQCADLLAHGVKYLHFFTMNQSAVVTQIVENLGLGEKRGKIGQSIGVITG